MPRYKGITWAGLDVDIIADSKRDAALVLRDINERMEELAKPIPEEDQIEEVIEKP